MLGKQILNTVNQIKNELMGKNTGQQARPYTGQYAAQSSAPNQSDGYAHNVQPINAPTNRYAYPATPMASASPFQPVSISGVQASGNQAVPNFVAEALTRYARGESIRPVVPAPYSGSHDSVSLRQQWQRLGQEKTLTLKYEVTHPDYSKTHINAQQRVHASTGCAMAPPTAQIFNEPAPFISQQAVVAARQRLNPQVLAFCEANLNRCVGRGECWDLGAEALKAIGARPAIGTCFGAPVKPIDAEPGDIIQFYSCKFQGPNYTASCGAPHHTAVIAAAHLDTIEVYEQNSCNRRYVTPGQYNLGHLTGGSFQIYRPLFPVTQC